MATRTDRHALDRLAAIVDACEAHGILTDEMTFDDFERLLDALEGDARVAAAEQSAA